MLACTRRSPSPALPGNPDTLTVVGRLSSERGTRASPPPPPRPPADATAAPLPLPLSIGGVQRRGKRAAHGGGHRYRLAGMHHGCMLQGRRGRVMSKPTSATERLHQTTKRVYARTLAYVSFSNTSFTVGRITPANVRPTPKAQPNACLKNLLRVSPRSHPTPHTPSTCASTPPNPKTCVTCGKT